MSQHTAVSKLIKILLIKTSCDVGKISASLLIFAYN